MYFLEYDYKVRHHMGDWEKEFFYLTESKFDIYLVLLLVIFIIIIFLLTFDGEIKIAIPGFSYSFII